ncbi:MAG: mannonate dehydratase [Firmicutes bacterium]|nr:mannonate dehydratase [Bacillota bacterium]
MMRIAVGQFSAATDLRLQYCQQLGASGVVLNTPELPGTRYWSYEDLRDLKARCERYGLRLEAIENVPLGFYDHAIWGGPERDAQIEAYQLTIKNMGRAGIPLLGYHWMANGVIRTGWEPRGRGGAVVSVFQADAVKAPGPEMPLDEEGLWANYRYFMEAVLPVAEASGVQLALHPDDPPLPRVAGVPRLFYSFENFQKAAREYPSEAWGLDFCLGTWSEMGPGVLDKLRYFVRQRRVRYVHFRDVRGYVPTFEECFLGEGNYDPVAVMQLLLDEGFDGFAIDDHVPLLVGDEGWGERGRAYTTGYLQGLLTALKAVRAH